MQFHFMIKTFNKLGVQGGFLNDEKLDAVPLAQEQDQHVHSLHF